jgi:hypothetical protein|mmetsp:Transcript_120279/g.188686  ORF Transcript_120279/g.188686 Transcript_120279/m.188686 type:complete len:738 (-) Transcript_120279:161-2374(-)|eukprot:CAMPEP_0169103340 /NCGR_PEP_ID=MMETSP1015-20121227/22663_1 /TAXON_ID=342587 /ORGANISM="Karlodinium micrum, Strain CCMP2283" /LENGTH=737 /DNA_ID=CAMNT_0009164531 /DNA_START=89 /DNA_END=2302 /DNA_ORIENTATION=+
MLATLCCKTRSKNGDRFRKAAQISSSLGGSRNGDRLEDINTVNRRKFVRNDESSEAAKPPKNRERSSFRVFVATNKEITNRSRAGPEALKEFIWRLCREKQPVNGVNVATVLHSSAKYPFILTPEVLDYLMDAVEEIDVDARAIGNALYGLQGLKISTAVKRVLRVMAEKVQQCREDFTPQQLGNALYGLQNLKASPEVHWLLRALEPKLRLCKEHFSVQGIASACFGMRSLCDSAEVRSIIDALAAKTEHLNDMRETQHSLAHVPGNLQKALDPHKLNKDFALDGWAIGNSLYGLQNLGDTPEVRRMIGAITAQVEKLELPMKAQEVTSSFYGLRSFCGAPPEIRRLLAALALQLQACSEMLLPKHIASSLYGLRWLHESDEGRSVLVVMAEKTRQCLQYFDGQAVGNALYGLQSYSNSKEVRSMLEALTPKVEKCPDILNAQEVGNALYGLRSMEDCTEVRRMLAVLTPKIEQCATIDPQAISNAMFGLHLLGSLPQTSYILQLFTSRIKQGNGDFSSQAIANAFSGIQTMEDSPITRNFIAALSPKLVECQNIRPEHIGNILINFRTVGDSSEVRFILRTLECKLHEAIELMQGQHISTSFTGLSYLGDSVEVMGVLSAFVPHVQRCKDFNPREIANCLSCLKSLSDSEVIRSLLKAFTHKVDNCIDLLKASSPNTDHYSDALIAPQLKKALQGIRGLGDFTEAQIISDKLNKLALMLRPIESRARSRVEGPSI